MNLIHLVWHNKNYIHKSFAYILRNILLQNREYKMNLMHFFYLLQVTLTTRYFGIYRKKSPQKAGKPSKNGIKKILSEFCHRNQWKAC